MLGRKSGAVPQKPPRRCTLDKNNWDLRELMWHVFVSPAFPLEEPYDRGGSKRKKNDERREQKDVGGVQWGLRTKRNQTVKSRRKRWPFQQIKDALKIFCCLFFGNLGEAASKKVRSLSFIITKKKPRSLCLRRSFTTSPWTAANSGGFSPILSGILRNKKCNKKIP